MVGTGSASAVLEPVRDCNGHVVWRIKVAPGEMTCLDCGETTIHDYCIRCAAENELSRQAARKTARLVPTESYLKPDEYERTR